MPEPRISRISRMITGLRDCGTTGPRDDGTTGLRDHQTTGLKAQSAERGARGGIRGSINGWRCWVLKVM